MTRPASTDSARVGTRHRARERTPSNEARRARTCASDNARPYSGRAGWPRHDRAASPKVWRRGTNDLYPPYLYTF
jgi:hypothetical protein